MIKQFITLTLLATIGASAYAADTPKAATPAVAEAAKSAPATNVPAATGPLAAVRNQMPFSQFKEQSLKFITIRISDLTQEKGCVEKSTNYDEMGACVELAKKNFKKATASVNPRKAEEKVEVKK